MKSITSTTKNNKRNHRQTISISPFNVDKLIILSDSKRLQWDLKVFRCNCHDLVTARISLDIWKRTKINETMLNRLFTFENSFMFVYFGSVSGLIVELFHLHLFFRSSICNVQAWNWKQSQWVIRCRRRRHRFGILPFAERI